jgi:hypothetical protein
MPQNMGDWENPGYCRFPQKGRTAQHWFELSTLINGLHD